MDSRKNFKWLPSSGNIFKLKLSLPIPTWMYCSSEGPNGDMVGLGDKPSNTVDSRKREKVL